MPQRATSEVNSKDYFGHYTETQNSFTDILNTMKSSTDGEDVLLFSPKCSAVNGRKELVNLEIPAGR